MCITHIYVYMHTHITMCVRARLRVYIQNWNSHKSVSAMHPHPPRSTPPPPEQSRSVLLRVHVLLNPATLLLSLVNKPPSLSSSSCRRLYIAAQVCDRGVQHLHQQGPHSVLEECLQTLRNDSFDSRERDTIITIITFVLYSFMYLFIYSVS